MNQAAAPTSRIIHVRPASDATAANDNNTEDVRPVSDATAANDNNTEDVRNDHDHVETANYNLDAVGLCVIIVSIFFMGIIRFLKNMDLEENWKTVVAFLYDWLHLAIERAFGASLPLYFLLRKDHSKAYAKRKLVGFISKYVVLKSGI